MMLARHAYSMLVHATRTGVTLVALAAVSQP